MALRIAHEINDPLTSIYGQLRLRISQIETGSFDYQVFKTFEEKFRGLRSGKRFNNLCSTEKPGNKKL